MDAIPCKHLLVAIDACYSGTFDPNFGTRGDGLFGTRSGELSEGQLLITEHDKHKTRLFFTSGESDQPTPDKSNFTKKFKEALLTKGGDDGILTSSEMFSNHLERAAPRPRGGDFGSDDAGSSFVFVAEKVQNTEGVLTLTLERQEWEKAKLSGSRYAFEEFKRRFPNSDFIRLANSELQKLTQQESDNEWARIRDSQNVQDFENFKTHFPNSSWLPLVESKIVDLNYKRKKVIPSQELNNKRKEGVPFPMFKEGKLAGIDSLGRKIYFSSLGGLYYITENGNKSFLNKKETTTIDKVVSSNTILDKSSLGQIVYETPKGGRYYINSNSDKIWMVKEYQGDKAIDVDNKGRTIYVNSKGGQYYINSNGDKTYIKADKN